MPDSLPSVVQLQGPSTKYNVRDWIAYSSRKYVQNKNATTIGNDCLRRSKCGTGPEEVRQLAGQNVQVSGSAPLPNDGHNHNPEGSAQLVSLRDFNLKVASSSPLRATGGFSWSLTSGPPGKN